MYTFVAFDITNVHTSLINRLIKLNKAVWIKLAHFSITRNRQNFACIYQSKAPFPLYENGAFLMTLVERFLISLLIGPLLFHSKIIRLRFLSIQFIYYAGPEGAPPLQIQRA